MTERIAELRKELLRLREKASGKDAELLMQELKAVVSCRVSWGVFVCGHRSSLKEPATHLCTQLNEEASPDAHRTAPPREKMRERPRDEKRSHRERRECPRALCLFRSGLLIVP